MQMDWTQEGEEKFRRVGLAIDICRMKTTDTNKIFKKFYAVKIKRVEGEVGDLQRDGLLKKSGGAYTATEEAKSKYGWAKEVLNRKALKRSIAEVGLAANIRRAMDISALKTGNLNTIRDKLYNPKKEVAEKAIKKLVSLGYIRKGSHGYVLTKMGEDAKEWYKEMSRMTV